jgi:hypothetical protein
MPTQASERPAFRPEPKARDFPPEGGRDHSGSQATRLARLDRSRSYSSDNHNRSRWRRFAGSGQSS